MTRRTVKQRATVEANNAAPEGAPSVQGGAEIVTVSQVVGEGAEAHVVVRVAGWQLEVPTGRGGDEPLIRDIDLAERLGYGRPAKIRDLIKRLEKDGKLQGVSWRPTVGRQLVNGGGERTFKVKEAWLTEAQALKVIAKSETAAADALLDEMIRVFRLAVRGLLPRPADNGAELAEVRASLAQMPAIFKELGALRDQVRTLTMQGPSAGRGGAEEIKSALWNYAKIMHSAYPNIPLKSWFQSGVNDLRGAIGFSGPATRFELMTCDQHGRARVKVTAMIMGAEKVAKQAGVEKQPDLFDLLARSDAHMAREGSGKPN